MNEMLEMPFFSFPYKKGREKTPKTPKNAILKEILLFFLFFLFCMERVRKKTLRYCFVGIYKNVKLS